MRSIAEFFAKIQNRQAQELFGRKFVADAIQKVLNMEIKAENITLKNGKATISGLSSTAKSQFFIKKNAILKEIASSNPTRPVTDLILR